VITVVLRELVLPDRQDQGRRTRRRRRPGQLRTGPRGVGWPRLTRGWTRNLAEFAQVKAKRETPGKTSRIKIIPLVACHFRARCLPGFPGFAECCACGLADCLSQLALPFAGRVQVDQRGPGAAVAHALHKFAQVRAFVGGQRVSGVP
jgi:hypothetical protein